MYRKPTYNTPKESPDWDSAFTNVRNCMKIENVPQECEVVDVMKILHSCIRLYMTSWVISLPLVPKLSPQTGYK